MSTLLHLPAPIYVQSKDYGTRERNMTGSTSSDRAFDEFEQQVADTSNTPLSLSSAIGCQRIHFTCSHVAPRSLRAGEVDPAFAGLRFFAIATLRRCFETSSENLNQSASCLARNLCNGRNPPGIQERPWMICPDSLMCARISS